MKRDQKLRDRYGYGGNGCRKKENDFRGFTRKILVESTEMCYDTSVGKIHAQIWFIGRTLASQAGKAGSIPVICFIDFIKGENAICVLAFSPFVFAELETFYGII